MTGINDFLSVQTAGNKSGALLLTTFLLMLGRGKEEVTINRAAGHGRRLDRGPDCADEERRRDLWRALIQLQVRERNRQIFAAGRDKQLIGRQVQHGLVAGQRRLVVDARLKPHRVNDPKLRDAEARI